MKVIGVLGPAGADRTRLVERLAGTLDGRVGTVTGADAGDVAEADAGGHPAGAETTVAVGDEWVMRGSDLDVDGALRRLAPDHDYAIVEGHAEAALPRVVLDGHDHAGETLAAAPSADDVDVAALVDALGEVDPYETLESLVARVKRSPRADRAGAIATFTGRVRARDGPEDPPTESLEFEKYDAVADEAMGRIEQELEARDGVQDVLLHHRTGVVEAGEDIVFVVVLAGHRRQAFRTVEDGIDRLKDEVPLFKKEVTVEETFWRHETDRA